MAQIDRVFETATSGRVAGMIIEPIQGFGGVIEMPQGYMAAAFEKTRRHGGVCIVDEIQTGFGRIGSGFWRFEEHGVQPDIVVLGKGIACRRGLRAWRGIAAAVNWLRAPVGRVRGDLSNPGSSASTRRVRSRKRAIS